MRLSSIAVMFSLLVGSAVAHAKPSDWAGVVETSSDKGKKYSTYGGNGPAANIVAQKDDEPKGKKSKATKTKKQKVKKAARAKKRR